MDGQQPDNSDGPSRFQPGETISPRTAEPGQNEMPPSNPMPEPVNPAPTPQFVVEPEILQPRSVASPPTGSEGSISWTASEFVAHHKSVAWYGLLALVSLIVATAVWLLTRDLITTIVILLAGAAFGAVGARQPRELAYRLDEAGLTIGTKHFDYREFLSFSIMQEGAFSSIVFMPLKRFMPLTTIYYDPSDEAKIVDLLSERLPLEERRHDLVDRLMWRIRF